MTITLYACLTFILSPLIWVYLKIRQFKGKEDSSRFAERLGKTQHVRPNAPLIWLHAASVGEAQSALILAGTIQKLYPDIYILLTSGTITSAQFVKAKMSGNIIHQYVPVDTPQAVERFLNYWQPTMALWIESELWPNLIQGIHRRHIPLYLVNAKMSERSFHTWKKHKYFARQILSAFHGFFCQTPEDSDRYRALGADNIHIIGNIKFSAATLSYDEAALTDLKNAIATRPFWLAASTHEGEEEIVLQAHLILQKIFPDLLTIIVPRHPKRAGYIANLIASHNLSFKQRSKHELMAATTAIYLADTLGELGLFYKLSPVVFLGGSLVPVGGHNLIEPAQFGVSIIHGPHMHTQGEMLRLFKAGSVRHVVDTQDTLAQNVEQLLTTPELRSKMGLRAKKIADENRNVIDKLMANLIPLLNKVSI